MNHFDRKLELTHGLETDFLHVLYYDFNEKYKSDYKSYEYNRICTIIEGEKKVKINNKQELTYNNKEFIILPPNATVDLEIDVPTKAIVFEINDALIDSVTKKVSMEFDSELIGTIKNNILFEKIDPVVQSIFDKIKHTAVSHDKNKEFLIDLFAQEMIYHLIKTKSVHDMLNVTSDNFIHLSTKMMKEHIADGLSISEIAYAINMSPANFSTKFKKVMGISPNEYFKNLKLLEAKKRLKEKSVTEVAYDLGYDNISHFIFLFKEKFGMTPKKYMLSENTCSSSR